MNNLNSFLSATPRRGTKTHFKENFVFLKKMRSQDFFFFSWKFLTSTQNSPHMTPFLDCIPTTLSYTTGYTRTVWDT